MTRASIAWTVDNDGPTLLPIAPIPTEQALEDWIEKTPSLIGTGLVILARQIQTESGPLDLLALDQSGALIVIELKRGLAYRETAGQVLDYAAWLAEQRYETLSTAVDENRRSRNYRGTMEEVLKTHLGESRAADWTPDDPGVRVVVASIGADASLRRIITFLSERYDVPLNGVFFDFCQGSVLIRTSVLSDEEQVATERRRGRGNMTNAQLEERARTNETEAIVHPILTSWNDLTERTPRPERGGYWTLPAARDGRASIARLHPSWDGEPHGTAWLWLSVEALAQDVNTKDDRVRATLTMFNVTLDNDRWITLNTQDISQYILQFFQALYLGENHAPQAAAATGQEGAVQPEGSR